MLIKLQTLLFLAAIGALILTCQEEEEEKSKLEFAEVTTTCNESDTEPEVTEDDITTPPSGAQQYIVGHYDVTKYLLLEKYQVHVFGTAGASDWMMVNAYELARNMIDAIQTEENRQIFTGHHIFVITDDDPIVPNGIAGQRNTGNPEYTIMNEELVCATAVDTIRPDNAPEYRAWDTPIHEFGHSVEIGLGLTATSIQYQSENNPDYQEAYGWEYFAWATERWFNAKLNDQCGTQALPQFEANFLGSVFNPSNIWKPTCEGKPE